MPRQDPQPPSRFLFRVVVFCVCLTTVATLNAAPGELDFGAELEMLKQQEPRDDPRPVAADPTPSTSDGVGDASLFEDDPVEYPTSGGVASDLPAALFRDFRISVVARVVGRDRQAVAIRFTPLGQRLDEVDPIDVLLTRKNGEPQPQRVNLAQGTRLVMELDPVDALGDTVSVTLRGDAILGQAFQQDRLSVSVD